MQAYRLQDFSMQSKNGGTESHALSGLLELPSTTTQVVKVSDLIKALSSETAGAAAPSGQLKNNIGTRIPHPYDFGACGQLIDAVNIHQVCISTKVDSTVGLGFETEEDRARRSRRKEMEEAAHEAVVNPPAPAPKPVNKEEAQADTRSKVGLALDGFCDEDFSAVIKAVAEDYFTCGNGYMEVVRSEGQIIGLWHMPARYVYVVREKERPHVHFSVNEAGGETLLYARAGDLDGFEKRNPNLTQPKITELLHFKMPTSRNRWYGVPDYMATVPWLELTQTLQQYNNDYFYNRAVPDLILTLLGAQVSKDDFDAIKAQIKGTVGAGNRHKSLVLNFPHPGLKVQLDRLTAENREKLGETWTDVALAVVSGHRVPPLLAGIQVPGKMAAANELPNALLAFQTLYIGGHQGVFQSRLANFFVNEGLGLTWDDFNLRKITDQFDMGQVDTMARMRTPSAQASAQGRSPAGGLKD